MANNAVEINSVSHRYDRTNVLSDVKLYAEKEKVLCIVGPSGCGKTTLLKIIAGLIRPTSGTVTLDGKRVTTTPPSKRDLGFVFQSENSLFPHLSVEDNIRFPFVHGKRTPVEGKSLEECTNDILGLTGLEPFRTRAIEDLSGGQKQRVSIARAMVYQPSLLLLDEPLTFLDNELKSELMQIVSDLKAKLRTTYIFVTHDDREVATLADNIAVILDGQVVQFGTKEEVLGSPINSKVRKLLNL